MLVCHHMNKSLLIDRNAALKPQDSSCQGYAITHKNHPCSKWARESISNWKWLRKLASELNREYKFRFERKNNHKS